MTAPGSRHPESGHAVQGLDESCRQATTKLLTTHGLEVLEADSGAAAEAAFRETVLRRLVEERRTRQKHLAGQARESRGAADPFVGRSTAIRRLADAAAKVAMSDRPILIQGETGTGKSLLARWLHDHSPRAEEAFVMAAMPTARPPRFDGVPRVASWWSTTSRPSASRCAST